MKSAMYVRKRNNKIAGVFYVLREKERFYRIYQPNFPLTQIETHSHPSPLITVIIFFSNFHEPPEIAEAKKLLASPWARGEGAQCVPAPRN